MKKKRLAVVKESAAEQQKQMNKAQFFKIREGLNIKKQFEEEVIRRKEEINLIIEILKLPKYRRNNFQIQQLMKKMKNFEFFKKVDDNYCKNSCKKLTYECFESDQIVYKAGDEANKFYFILQGSVGEYTNLEEQEVKKEEDLENKQSVQFKENKDNEKEEEEMQLEFNKLYKEGKYFGQYSIINETKRRFTMKTVQKCHFAILDKKEYDKLLKSNELKKFYKIFNQLHSFSLFSEFPRDVCKNIFRKIIKMRTSVGQIIYKQGDSTNAFYVILSGEFQIFQKVKVAPNTPQQNSQNVNDLLKFPFINSFDQQLSFQVYFCFRNDQYQNSQV